jgi:GR25 family glycosyltransferase involved in LPS biosynthesis
MATSIINRKEKEHNHKTQAIISTLTDDNADFLIQMNHQHMIQPKYISSDDKDDASTDSSLSTATNVSDDDQDVIIRNDGDFNRQKTTTNNDMTQYWNVFDHMICLNLKEREDRLLHSMNEFKKIGILDRVEFQINERSNISGLYGCFESHIKAVKSAYNKGYSNVLILEDDCSFEAGWEKIVKDSADFIKNAPDPNAWEYYNLNGVIIYGVEDCPWNRNIINGKAVLAHIYCLSRLGMKRILDLYDGNISREYCIDVAYAFALRHSFVHKQHSTIIQLTEVLGTDHEWATMENFSVSLSPQMRKFIQTNVLPLSESFNSEVNLFMAKYIPYHFRPWLCHSSLLAFTSMKRHEILIVRRNGMYKEDSFLWNDTIFCYMFKMLLGLVAYILCTMSTTRRVSPQINSWNLLLALLNVKK